MLDKYICLKKLAAARRPGDVVVTTMSVSMPWAALSDSPLDFAHVDSAMGHAAGFAFGLAIAQPGRRVLCLNGDGSTLMCLGTLVTMMQHPAPNFTLVITANGTYEVTGSQPVPGAGTVDFAGLARAAGVPHVVHIDTQTQFDTCLADHFTHPGPSVFVWQIEPAGEPVPQLAAPIHERARHLRAALLGG